MQDYVNDLSHINNPPEVDFYDSSKDNFLELKSMSEVFEMLGMHDDEYQSALKISNGQDFNFISAVRPTLILSRITLM